MPRTNKKKRQRNPVRYSLGALWVSIYESPYAELITGAGTVIGSALISLSGGQMDRWLLMVVGALIIVIGLAPSWARSMSLNRGIRRDALLDARADVADTYVRRVLADASAFVGMPRADRVDLATREIEVVVEDIWERFYSGSETVRVVYFGIRDDGMKLVPAVTVGREGDARSFDASADVRGQLGLDRLDIDEMFEFQEDVDELPIEWGSQDRGYVAFISIPVRVGVKGYGLISVDSSAEGELDARDGESLAVYASALGFYFASADRGKHRGTNGGGSDG